MQIRHQTDNLLVVLRCVRWNNVRGVNSVALWPHLSIILKNKNSWEKKMKYNKLLTFDLYMSWGMWLLNTWNQITMPGYFFRSLAFPNWPGREAAKIVFSSLTFPPLFQFAKIFWSNVVTQTYSQKHSYTYRTRRRSIPSLTAFGGVIVVNGIHVWRARR